jgi:antibiotic biosynthesis monooxygenase (ABM) superfamily enzyme
VDDVHLLRDPAAGALPAPVSTVITTRIKPGQEAAFRAWEQRIAAVQARQPGFLGYRFEPPIPGVQDDWVAILRFDTERNLQAWLDSPERRALVREAEAFVEQFHTRTVRSGFEQWFPGGAGNGAKPSVWKQNMVVLLVLYPVVFLLGRYVQAPLLMGWAALPFWAALFIGNVASVVLMNWLVPWTSRALGWWLRPRPEYQKRVDAAGTAVVVGLYAVCLLAFFLIS